MSDKFKFPQNRPIHWGRTLQYGVPFRWIQKIRQLIITYTWLIKTHGQKEPSGSKTFVVNEILSRNLSCYCFCKQLFGQKNAFWLQRQAVDMQTQAAGLTWERMKDKNIPFSGQRRVVCCLFVLLLPREENIGFSQFRIPFVLIYRLSKPPFLCHDLFLDPHIYCTRPFWSVLIFYFS